MKEEEQEAPRWALRPVAPPRLRPPRAEVPERLECERVCGLVAGHGRDSKRRAAVEGRYAARAAVEGRLARAVVPSKSAPPPAPRPALPPSPEAADGLQVQAPAASAVPSGRVAAAAGPFGQVAPAAADHRLAARHEVRAVAAGLQGLHEVRVVAGLHEVHFDPAAVGLHEVHPVEQAARREARDLAADHHEARAAADHHEVRFGQVQADGGAQEREVAHPPFRRERRSLVPVSQPQAVPRLFSSTIGCPRRGCGRGFSLFLKGVRLLSGLVIIQRCYFLARTCWRPRQRACPPFHVPNPRFLMLFALLAQLTLTY